MLRSVQRVVVGSVHIEPGDLVAVAFDQPLQRGHARFEGKGRVLPLEVPEPVTTSLKGVPPLRPRAPSPCAQPT
jgi:hypothetical protein